MIQDQFIGGGWEFGWITESLIVEETLSNQMIYLVNVSQPLSSASEVLN